MTVFGIVIPALAILVVLVGMAYQAFVDVFTLTMDDWSTWMLALLSVAALMADGITSQQWLWATLSALAVFLLYLELGACERMGGGDVKLAPIPALVLGAVNPILVIWWVACAFTAQSYFQLLLRGDSRGEPVALPTRRPCTWQPQLRFSLRELPWRRSCNSRRRVQGVRPIGIDQGRPPSPYKSGVHMTRNSRNITFGKSRYLPVLRNKDGIEVSLPSLIITVGLSIVIVGSVVLGGIFAIPFTQNAAAKGDLTTVASSEAVYYGNSASGTPSYGTAALLVSTKAIVASQKPVAIKVPAAGTVGYDRYCIGTKSQTGTYFWMVSGSSTVFQGNTAPDFSADTAAGLAAFACPTTAQLDNLRSLDPASPLAGISTTSPVL